MQRREFLKQTLGGTLTLAAANAGSLALAQELGGETAGQSPSRKVLRGGKLRGVNLGSWLVLEKWMVPDVYRNTQAPDEYTLCLELGDKAKARLTQHRETFITAEDFSWIKKCGLNAVRLPVTLVRHPQ